MYGQVDITDKSEDDGCPVTVTWSTAGTSTDVTLAEVGARDKPLGNQFTATAWLRLQCPHRLVVCSIAFSNSRGRFIDLTTHIPFLIGY